MIKFLEHHALSASSLRCNAAAVERYCDICNQTIGSGNSSRRFQTSWAEHVKSKKHKENKNATTNTCSLSTSFTAKPKIPPLVTASGAATASSHTTPSKLSSPNGSSYDPDIIDVDSMPESSEPNPLCTSDLAAQELLARLGLTISTLPSTSALATPEDMLASFAGDPTALVGPDQDPWEDVIRGAITAAAK
ncbi:hypothetical protein C8R45DRAFT_1103543 [Mycena sanguinolenta]|nr:hypothetical protein C8R45DRAFT_1103543 [Mycena sanguinolenta]